MGADYARRYGGTAQVFQRLRHHLRRLPTEEGQNGAVGAVPENALVASGCNVCGLWQKTMARQPEVRSALHCKQRAYWVAAYPVHGQPADEKAHPIQVSLLSAEAIVKVANTLPNLIQRVERKTGVPGFMEVLYLCFSQFIECQPRLQATFRRKPCPEYPAASRLFRKFCGIHYVSRGRSIMHKSKFTAFLMLAAFCGNSFAQSVTIESDASIYKSVTREQAINLAKYINAHGYSCRSVSAVTPFTIKRGWYVTCNQYNYRFEVEDRGGKYIVTVK